MKVPLIKDEDRPGAWRNERSGDAHWLAALPFFISPRQTMVHRVRSVTTHLWDGEPSHTSVKLWCGSSRFIETPETWGRFKCKHIGNRLTAEPDKRMVFCATCEGRAVGAGQLGTAMLAGRMVKFSPREGRLTA